MNIRTALPPGPGPMTVIRIVLLALILTSATAPAAGGLTLSTQQIDAIGRTATQADAKLTGKDQSGPDGQQGDDRGLDREVTVPASAILLGLALAGLGRRLRRVMTPPPTKRGAPEN